MSSDSMCACSRQECVSAYSRPRPPPVGVADLKRAPRSFIQVPFLNLLAAVVERAGSVRIRVGGNTQETATLVDSLADNAMIEKAKSAPSSSAKGVCTT